MNELRVSVGEKLLGRVSWNYDREMEAAKLKLLEITYRIYKLLVVGEMSHIPIRYSYRE